MRKLVLSLVLLIFGFASAVAQSVTQPPQGTRLRKELLDAARPVFEKETEGPVEFVVHRLNVMDGWAFGDFFLQRPGGRQVSTGARPSILEDEKNDSSRFWARFFLLKRPAQIWNRCLEFVTGSTVWPAFARPRPPSSAEPAYSQRYLASQSH